MHEERGPWSSAWSSLLLIVGCTLASIAACSGGAGGVASNLHRDSGVADGSGSAGDSGVDSSVTLPEGSVQQTLSVVPPQATITINGKSTPASQQFKAKLQDGTVVTANWVLDSYDLGTITQQGLFKTSGLSGGKLKVTATYGKVKASAALTVLVKIDQDVLSSASDPGPTPADKAALKGTPAPDPGAGAQPPDPSEFLYPYDKTVMPQGLLAPLLQLSPGSLPPVDAKVSLNSTWFSWNGYYKVQNPAQPQLTIPQDVWDAALASTKGQKLKVEIDKAAAGKAYGPYAISITVAAGSLTGAVYYQTYQKPENGLWLTRPGTQAPAKLIKPGCLVCHSLSANGKRLSLGTDDAKLAAQSGVYNVGPGGSLTQVTGAPPGLGGDSRGLSFGVFTPDGKYVMRSQSNFWGGPNQLAWKIDDAQGKLLPSTVVGLKGVSALLPTFSPDGKRFAFTNGPGGSPSFGVPSRSISVMDVAVNDQAGTAGTLTFSQRQLVLDNGASGRVTKYVTFMPDSDLLVLQESDSFYSKGFDDMLPTYGPSGTPGQGHGRLFLIRISTQQHVQLVNADTGSVASDQDHNYEPFALPVPAGGYYWIVFTSNRTYGNTYTGSAVRKQLWVAAITPNVSGADPSHPAFYLPTQSPTKNERAFWALDPCKAAGGSCQSGDQCCAGFCRPVDQHDPQSPKVCKKQSQGCSQISEKCSTSADCCDAASGVKCLGGYCSPPPVPQ